MPSMPLATKTLNSLYLFVLCSHCHLIWPPGIGAGQLYGPLLPNSSIRDMTKALYSRQITLDLSGFLHGTPTHTPQHCVLSILKSRPKVGVDMYSDTYSTISRFALFSLLHNLLGTDRLFPFFLCFITTFLIQNSMVNSALPSFAYIKKGDPQTWETFFSLHKV